MKKVTLGAGALALVGLLFIGIMLLANSLLRRAQFDLTSDRVHTIAEGTDHIVKNLKEPVNLYFFFSQQTAAAVPQVKAHGTRVRELLEELVARSNGKLTLKVIDPQPFTEEEDRATEFGITATPFSARGDKLYLGLAATNSTDGKDSIPYLDPENEVQLEYDVAKLIYKLSTPKKPVVGWLSSLPMGGDFDMQTGRPRAPWVVFGQVEQMYTVRNLDASLTKIDADIDVLVLVHPKELPPAALYAIDQFGLRGGHVLAFIDPNSQADSSGQDPQNPMAALGADHSSHLEPLLKAWGVDFKPDQVVVDLERGLAVQLREGEPPTQHIAILGFDAQSVSKDIITGRLDNLTMATAGSLKPVAGSKLAFEPLITTSKEAGTLPELAARRFQTHGSAGRRRTHHGQRGERISGGSAAGRVSAGRCAQGIGEAAQRRRHRRLRPAAGLHVGRSPQRVRPDGLSTASEQRRARLERHRQSLGQRRSHQHPRSLRLHAALRSRRRTAPRSRLEVPGQGAAARAAVATDRRPAHQAADRQTRRQ
jgi:ABC-type uncharacterized transport system involved in gliding motility auxiliary subunit